MSYQLLANGKDCGYPVNETLEDAIIDLQDQHTRLAYQSSTEMISDIKDNAFDVSFHSGKTIIFKIEEIAN